MERKAEALPAEATRKAQAAQAQAVLAVAPETQARSCYSWFARLTFDMPLQAKPPPPPEPAPSPWHTYAVDAAECTGSSWAMPASEEVFRSRQGIFHMRMRATARQEKLRRALWAYSFNSALCIHLVSRDHQCQVQCCWGAPVAGRATR